MTLQSASYYQNKITELQSKGVPEAKDFYNQSFIDRMNEARNNIDNLVAEQDRANSVRQNSRDEYNTFVGEMKNYTVYSSEAENKFGVKTALNTYEDSKKAVAATQQALNTLPSSINATSNVVLSQSQRESAFNNAADKLNSTLVTQQKMSDTYEKAFQRAREEATNMANQLYREQATTAQRKNLVWLQHESAFSQAEEKLRQMRAQLDFAAIDYSTWQLNQAGMALDKYNAELNGVYRELELVRQNERADIQAKADYHAEKAQEARESWAKSVADGYYRNKYQRGAYMGDVVGLGLNFLNAFSR